MAGEAAAHKALVQAQRRLRTMMEQRRERMNGRIASRSADPTPSAEPLVCVACAARFDFGGTCAHCGGDLVSASLAQPPVETAPNPELDAALATFRRQRVVRAGAVGVVSSLLLAAFAVCLPLLWPMAQHYPALDQSALAVAAYGTAGTLVWMRWEARLPSIYSRPDPS
jgi:hypothetical protein